MIRQLSTPQSGRPLSTTVEPARAPHCPVVTATARLSRELRHACDAVRVAEGRRVWDSPEILPIGAWLEECFRAWLWAPGSACGLELLGPTRERVVWEDIVRSSPEGNALLDAGATAQAALDAWNLSCAWMLPVDAPEWRDTADSEAFHGWASEFRRRMERHGWLSGGQLPEFLAGRVAAGELPVPARITLAGFLERTPAEQLLFGAFEAAGCVVVEETVLEGAGPARGARLALSDPEAEIRTAAAWACRLVGEASRDGRRSLKIGIVVPNLDARRSRIERVFASAFHPDRTLRPEEDPRRLFNISLGPGLSGYPLVDAALDILRLGAGPNPLESTGRVLRSCFVAGGRDEWTRRALLDRRLREQREPEVDVGRLLRLAGLEGKPYSCPVLAERWSRWQRLGRELPDPQMPSDWASSWSGLLDAIGWPGDRALSSVEYQTAAAWRELLSEFSGLDGVSGPLPLERARNLLGRLAAARQFQPESDPAPIQILGAFEARGLRFDHLWIVGADDGAWPPSKGPSPFLPLRLQRIAGSPGSSPARELEFARLLTDHLRRSAPAVVVSCPRIDGDTALRPSSLFMDMPEASVEDIGATGGADDVERLRESSDLETIEDRSAPPWDPSEGDWTRGGTSIFKWQAACPFRAFAQVRLGAVAFDSAVDGLGPRDRGLLVHDALRRIWREFSSHQGLVTADPAHVAAVVGTVVGAAIQSMSASRAVLRKRRFAQVEHRRLTRLIGDWLELEKRRAPFTVLEQDTRRHVEVGGVCLSIRADRVDRLNDGTAVVVDYKTGEHSPAEWDGDRPDEPQLPLYAATAEGCLGGIFFGVLKPGKLGFRGTAVSGDLVPGVRTGRDEASLPERIREWRAVLDRLGRDFRSGAAAVDPKRPARTCLECSLSALCRIHEIRGEHRAETAHD